MSEKKPNYTCQWCGKRYYACPSCEIGGAYKALACSKECYAKIQDFFAKKNAPAAEVKEENKKPEPEAAKAVKRPKVKTQLFEPKEVEEVKEADE